LARPDSLGSRSPTNVQDSRGHAQVLTSDRYDQPVANFVSQTLGSGSEVPRKSSCWNALPRRASRSCSRSPVASRFQSSSGLRAHWLRSRSPVIVQYKISDQSGHWSSHRDWSGHRAPVTSLDWSVTIHQSHHMIGPVTDHRSHSMTGLVTSHQADTNLLETRPASRYQSLLMTDPVTGHRSIPLTSPVIRLTSGHWPWAKTGPVVEPPTFLESLRILRSGKVWKSNLQHQVIEKRLYWETTSQGSGHQF